MLCTDKKKKRPFSWMKKKSMQKIYPKKINRQ